MAILLSHGGALGDFIATLPSIRLWRSLHPGEATVLLGRPAHAALCEDMFEEVWDSGSARFASLFGPEPDARLADRFRSFVSALLFAPAGSRLAANLAGFGVRDINAQEPFPQAGAGNPVHIVDYHLSLFPDAVLTAAERVPRIAPPDDPSAARAVRTGTIAIHPGSGSARKNWPLPRFVELARRIAAAQGTRLAWILGPAERAVALSLARALRLMPDAELWRDLPLPSLAARLSRCSLFVGNDSGVSHLAAAVGCPSIVIFGATSSALWAPRGERVSIVDEEGRGMEEIRVERVLKVACDVLRGQ